MKAKKYLIAAAIAIAMAAAPRAQDRVASSGFTPSARPGWVFTPSMGVAETYDDNVSLFDVHIAAGENNDFVTAFMPAADVQYTGAHTQFGAGYSGSMLTYRTFDTLDRWAQRAHADFRRQETARMVWTAAANADSTPTTDAILFGGLPYRRTGAKTADGRATVEYQFNARDGLMVSGGFQIIKFDKPETAAGFLQGGHALESNAAYRHQLNHRFGIGTDYGIRRSNVVDDSVPFITQSIQGAVDYALSPSWSMSALAGVVLLMSNAETEGRTGPALRVGFSHHRGSAAVRTWYLHSYTPSFAFGGTVKTQEAGVGLRMQLFHSRRWFTDQSALFRDDEPLTNDREQLPLRQLRTNSVIGWMPNPFVRIEGFYTYATQSSLLIGGDVRRNRIGIQVVTSKPMRIE